MSTNCLVTKLKSSVSNTELEKLGVLKFKVTYDSNISSDDQKVSALSLDITVNDTVVIKSDENGGFGFTLTELENSPKQELTLNAGIQTVFFKNDSYNVELSNKYAVVVIKRRGSNIKTPIVFNINHFKYLIGLQTFDIRSANVEGDLSAMQNLGAIQEINLGSAVGFTGDIASLAKFPTLQKIYAQGTPITGSIDSLGNLIALTNLITNSTVLIGSLDTFATSQVAKGRVSGTCTVICNGIITYQGNIVPNSTTKTITFDSSIPNGYSIS